MKTINLKDLKTDLKLKAYSGIDFILAAGIIWICLALLWTIDATPYNKSVYTFMLSSVLLPLAWLFSKLFKTQWKIPENPLQPLGLWLNFAQLLYFPFLVFVLLKSPDHFIMTYAITTGAHLFPYAWLYNELGYAVVAFTISAGSLLLALSFGSQSSILIPLFTSILLFLLAIRIVFQKSKSKKGLKTVPTGKIVNP